MESSNMMNEFRGRLVLLISVLILVSASSFAIIEGGGSQSLGASPDASTAVTLSDGFTLSTTGSGTTSGYTIVVVVPDNNNVPYKDYTISFTGTFTVPTNPSYGTFTASADAGSGSGSGGATGVAGSGLQTAKYTAKDGATRAQIGADLSSITYNGAGTVTVTVTDGGTSAPQATQTYDGNSVGNNVYVSTIGSGPKHYASLSEAYNDTSYTDPTIRLLTDIEQNTTLVISKNLTITSDSSSKVCSIKHSSDSGTTILNIRNGTVVLKDITIDGNKQGSGFLVTVGSESDVPSLTLDSGATVKNGAAGGIRLGLADKANIWLKSYGSLYIEDGAVIEGNSGGSYWYILMTVGVGGIGVTGDTTFVMNGGEIRNNTGDNAGGLIFFGNSGISAEMNGGSITGNTALYGAGAIGVYLDAEVHLNGGTITGNRSGASYGAVSKANTIQKENRLYIGGFADGKGTPLVIQENYDAVGIEKNLCLDEYVVVERDSGKVLAKGSMIGVSSNKWPSEKIPDVNVIGRGSTEAEKAYFKSDDLVLAGLIREEETGIIKLSYKDRGQDEVHISSEGNDVSGNGTAKRPFRTLTRAYELVKDNGTICLRSDIEAGDADKEIYVTVESKNITITSFVGKTYTVTRTSDTNLIYIKSGSVTLKNITLTDSGGKDGDRTKALVFVAPKDGKTGEASPTLVLGSGSTVKNVGMAKDGGGNEGGVIVVYPGGKLTMEDGATIQDCTATRGSVYCISGTFEMSGGMISGCSSYNADGGAAVCLSKISTMTMSGGTIRGCGSTNSGCAGTVYLDYWGYNTFEMSGGSITGNTATFGGGVFVDRSIQPDVIKVSGTAKISGNKNASGGESNICLIDGQGFRPYVVISGEMSSGADVGVYTASEIAGKVKVAEFADGVSTEGYASYIHSDKPAIAGIELDGNSLYLSLEANTAVVNFGSLPQWMESVGGSLTQNIAGTGGTTTAIDPIGLVSKSDYAEVTDKQADAIRDALKDKGLDVFLIRGTIIIDGTPNAKVDVDLATILKDLEPNKAQATVKGSDGSTVGEYATVAEALSAAKSGQTIVITTRDTGLTPVDNGTLKQGVTLEINSGTYRADGGDATVDVDKDGNVALSNGKLEVANGAVSVPMGGGSADLKVNGGSYSIATGSQSATLTVPDGKTATADDGASYSGGAFVISRSGSAGDQETSVKGDGSGYGGTVASKPNANGDTDTIIIVDSGTEISIAADGSMKLVDGKGSSTGTMTASIAKIGEMSFSGTAKYTVDTGGSTLATDASGTVTVESVAFTGAAGQTFTLGKEGEGSSAVYTIIAPNGAKFRSGTAMVIVGEGSVKAEIDSDGKLTLAEGAGAVEGTVSVRIGGSTISIGTNNLITVDIRNGKPTVGIPSGNKATIGSTGYEATADGTEILIGGDKNVLMKGAVKIGQDGSIAIDSGSVVTNRGTGNVTVSAGDGGSAAKISLNGKVRIDDDEYEASGTGATFAIDKSGNILLVGGSVRCGDSTISVSTGDEVLIRGTKVLEKGASILGLNGKAIKNSSDSDGISIAVGINWAAKTNTLTIPKDGVAEIDGAGYVSAQDGTEILIDGSGMKLTDGAVKIPKGREISLGTARLKVENEGNADVTVSVEGGNSNVGISPNGKAKIGSISIESTGTGMTAEIGSDGKLTLTEGAGSVTGLATVSVRIGGEVTDITVPQDRKYTINVDGGEVSGLAAGDELTIGDLMYISKNGGGFKIRGNNIGTLLSEGDAAIVPSGKAGSVVLDDGTGDRVISVPADGTGDSGKIEIIKTSTGATVKVAADGDTFKVGESAYTAGSSDAEFAIGTDGDVTIAKGSAILNDGDSIWTAGGSKVANPSDSSNDRITVRSGTMADDSTEIIVPSDGSKARIDDDEYEASGTGATFAIDKSGNILLVGGSVRCGDSTISVSTGDEVLIRGTKVLEKGASILGLNGKAIKNSSDSDGISIAVGINWAAKTNTLTIPKDGVAEIDGAGYVSAQDGTEILIDGSGMKLTDGAVKIPKGREISLGTARLKVENEGNADVTVSVEGGNSNVGISPNGKAKIGDKEISSGSSNSITVDIGNEGGLSVTMSNGDKVYIGSTEYEAAEAGTKILIGDDANTLAGGAVKVGQDGSITVKDGPTVTNGGTGDVTVSLKDGGSAVKMSDGGKAKIDGMEYEAASDGTEILNDGSKNVLMSGAVKIGKDEEIAIREGKTAVKSLADGDDEKVTVTIGDGGSGSISIPAGGKAEIGGISIESTGAGITAKISKDGKISVEVDPGNIVRIGVVTYTGSSPHGSMIYIDTGTGAVTVYDMRIITFDTGTGYSIDIDCGKGETITLPTGREAGYEISKPGSVLVGWRSADSQGGTKDYGLGSDYTVSEDDTLSAIWVENENVVVYYTDRGGSINGSTYAILDDGIASLDSTAVKDGYAFLGWTTTDSAGNKVAYAPGLTVEASGTVYMAAYLVSESSLSGLCTVNYDSGYGAGTAFKQYADSGVYVSLPTARDMHRDGYTFLGWEVVGASKATMAITLGADMGKRVSGTYLVSENVTFKAVWAAEGSDYRPWWNDDDDPYIPQPDTGGSSESSTNTILIVAVAAVAVLLLELMVLSSRRRS